MNPWNRRSFIKSTFAGLSVAAADHILSPLSGIATLALAQPAPVTVRTSGKGPLIVVFQRGAADGLAMLSPLDDPDFKAARPPEMRFTKAESSGKTSFGEVNFYWHPQASDFVSLFESKKLLVWQSVGIMNETRSHFEAQEIVERGVNNLSHLPDRLGWMAREHINHPQERKSSRGVNLYGGGNNMPRTFLGAPDNLSIRDLQQGITMPNGEEGLKAMRMLAQTDSSHSASMLMKEHLDTMSMINGLMPKGRNNKVTPYVSAGQTEYLNNDPAVGLRSLARLLSLDVPIQYAWIDHLGWDTHENQPGRFSQLTQNLGQALMAFAQDMEARKLSYTLVVMTEFGRRLRSNRSNGTDHGHGGLAMVMGDRVPGGQVKGRWPGLNTAALDRQVDLAVTTDYQDMLRQAQFWCG